VSDYDVAIVGAGPAGAAAALVLGRAGARVAVLERESLPRYKTCGGGLVRRGAAWAGVDVTPVVERACRRVTLYLHDLGCGFTVERAEPLIAMTMRERLDFLLVTAAAAGGAALLAPCEVQSLTANAGAVRLGTTRGSVQADFVIAADGALGPTARLAGWPDERYLAPALEYEIPVNDRTLARFAAEPRFDAGAVPFGYGWVFPKASHLSVGVMSMHRGARELHELLARYLTFLGIDGGRTRRRHGSVIPVRSRSGPFIRGRVLVAGDAAGFVDPVTAEGISLALRSGQLAAQALARGSGEADAAAAYEAALSREILPDLRAGRLVAHLMHQHPALRRSLFARFGQSLVDGVADVFAGAHGYGTIPRRTVARWTRRVRRAGP